MTSPILHAPAWFHALGSHLARVNLVAVVLCIAGCRAHLPPAHQGDGGVAPDSTVRIIAGPLVDNSGCLADGFVSPEAVGRAVVDALNEGRREQLHRYRVNREEYLSCLWKRFPASANMPGDFAYANLEKKCHKGVDRWIARWGSRALVFGGIRFTKPLEDYRDFVLHRGTVLSAATPDGVTVELPILGSIVEMQGRFKLLSYDDG